MLSHRETLVMYFSPHLTSSHLIMSKSITKKPGDICVEDDGADQKLQRVPSVLQGDIKEVDDAILHAQGHEAVLTRQFNWLSALGLAFSVTNSWVGYLVRMNHFPT